jgi:hypothetical protein
MSAADNEFERAFEGAKNLYQAAAGHLSIMLEQWVIRKARAAYPDAAVLHANGEYNADGDLHLHAEKLTRDDGTILVALGNWTADNDEAMRRFDAFTDEIDPNLDWLASLKRRRLPRGARVSPTGGLMTEHERVDPTDSQLRQDIARLQRLTKLLDLHLSSGMITGALRAALTNISQLSTRILEQLEYVPETTVFQSEGRLGEATASLLVERLGGEVPDKLPEDFE